MILNSRLQSEQLLSQHTPVLLIHGLFGSLDNLGGIARGLRDDRPVIQLDVRNHGLSPRARTMDYIDMAQDVLDTLDHYQIETFSVIGHSMGGKISMALTALAASRMEKLVLIDIAPVDYQTRRHDKIFTAINAVSDASITTRQSASETMRQYITEEGVIQFLLKSFHEGEWRFNVPVLWDEYHKISGWEPIPAWPGEALFIRGGNSPYLDDRHRATLLSQFPQARAYVIAGSGHWVHAEKPETVLRCIRRFFTQ
ncbi:esterase [Enterobacteriaceae bacterium LUAb1]